jgi:hypothetical protein
MKISDAQYILIDGHPFIKMKLDGKEAMIGEFKYSMLELGCVPLFSRDITVNWEAILPPIRIYEQQSKRELILRGCTNDPGVIAIAHTYWKSINNLEGLSFHEGPILSS